VGGLEVLKLVSVVEPLKSDQILQKIPILGGPNHQVSAGEIIVSSPEKQKKIFPKVFGGVINLIGGFWFIIFPK
jgi:hypothetical protein